MESLQRLDSDGEQREKILPLCRLAPGEVWHDPVHGHKIGVLDATDPASVTRIMGDEKTALIINDPPYNFSVGNKKSTLLFSKEIDEYIAFSRKWVQNAVNILAENASLYIWIGADQNAGYQPLPDFMIMMREFSALQSRSFITVRNQRGYGTAKNWMSVRQELLYYTKGKPHFQVTYTDIPKILKGYYKEVGGKVQSNQERGKSPTIRPGNVWVDIQQVFYRMAENVPGAYAQKPLKAIERIILSSSEKNGVVVDFFSHSGTTVLACEKLGRTCYAFDIDPVFAELSIRRLELYRKTKLPGWQWKNPFPEIGTGGQKELFLS